MVCGCYVCVCTNNSLTHKHTRLHIHTRAHTSKHKQHTLTHTSNRAAQTRPHTLVRLHAHTHTLSHTTHIHNTHTGGHPYRYTSWVHYDFKKFLGNFSRVHGTELYNLTADVDEAFNLAGTPAMRDVESVLHTMLVEGWRKQ